MTVKTLASGNATPLEGEVVTFEIEVTNNGKAQANNIFRTDFLHAGLAPSSGNGTVAQGSYNVDGLFEFGTLDVG